MITALGDINQMSNTIDDFEFINPPTPQLVREWEMFLKVKQLFQIV